MVHYLCPKLDENNIPGRTCIGDAVLEKVVKLDSIDMELIAVSTCPNIVLDSLLISIRISLHVFQSFGMGGLQNGAGPFHP